MADTEQILVRLGMDNSSFAQGLRGGLASLKEFGQKTHERFQEMGLAGRGFHRVLEQIKEVSPGVGTALQFALNPVVAIAGLAVGVFVKFKEHIKEVNAELDKMAALNAKSVFGADQIRAATQEVEALDEAYQKFQQHRAPKAGENLVEKVNQETDAVKKLRAAWTAWAEARNERAKAEKEQRQALEKRKELTVDVARATELLKAKEDQLKAAEEAFNKAGGIEKYNELERHVKSMGELTTESTRAELAAAKQANEEFSKIKNLYDIFQFAKGRLEQLKDEQEALNTLTRIATSDYESAADKVKAYDEAIKSLSKTIRGLKENAPDQAAIKDRAKNGSWFDPVAQAARQFLSPGASQNPTALKQARETLIKAGLLEGDIEPHLPGFGSSPRGSYRLSAKQNGQTVYDTGLVTKQMAEDIKDLAEMARGNGIKTQYPGNQP